MEKKYRFEKPKLEIVRFANEDIIVTSSFGEENQNPGGGDLWPKQPGNWW